MSPLLHPTDFSANADQAFQFACSIARDRAASLIVLHVVSPRACEPHDLCGNALNPTSEQYHRIWNRFDQLRSLAGTAKVSFEVRIGETLDAILDVIAQEHCDLVVLAGRAHADSFYQLHGCISESLLRRAPCSVLLLRHFHGDEFQQPAAEESTGQKTQTESCCTEGGVIGARW